MFEPLTVLIIIVVLVSAIAVVANGFIVFWLHQKYREIYKRKIMEIIEEEWVNCDIKSPTFHRIRKAIKEIK